MLRSQSLTLLSPLLWDDKNDAHSLERYRHSVGAKRVLALCFAEHYETYHHWKIYAPGAAGVCIEFDKQKLISAFHDLPNIRTGKVIYKTIQQLKKLHLPENNLPFIKRFPYGDEEEFLIIYTDNKTSPFFEDFPIQLSCITRINLSPWLSPALDESFRESIRSIHGMEKIHINRSKLVNYEDWKKCINIAHPLPEDEASS